MQHQTGRAAPSENGTETAKPHFKERLHFKSGKKKKRNNLLFILLAVGPPQPLDCLHSIYVKANKILPRDKKRSVWGTVS